MTAIKTFAMAICVTAIASSLFYFFIPQEKRGTEKMLRFAVSLFFLSSLVSACFAVDDLPTFSDFTVETEELSGGLQAEIDAQVLSLTEEALEQRLLSSLSEAGIAAENMEVQAYITEDGSIEISKVILSPVTEMGLTIIHNTVGSDVEIVQEGGK